MKPTLTVFTVLLLAVLASFDFSVASAKKKPAAVPAKSAPSAPTPTYADISFGPHPHQIMDLYLLHKDAAPMFFENEWGLTKPDDITQANYDTHSPRWALGFQKLALAAGATCYVEYPGHPADEAAQDIWDFVAKRLLKPEE